VCTYPQDKGAEHVEHYRRLHRERLWLMELPGAWERLYTNLALRRTPHLLLAKLTRIHIVARTGTDGHRCLPFVGEGNSMTR